MCWQDVSRAKLAALLPETVVTPSTPAQKEEGDRKPEYPKPDTNQMIPFQPRHLAREYQPHAHHLLTTSVYSVFHSGANHAQSKQSLL